jgi:ribosome biogenesis GTPase A
MGLVFSEREATGAAPFHSLAPLIDRAIAALSGSGADTLVRGLEELRDRLVAERLQLAVLGQFKRGKSTLLNALLGMELLPMGVLPLTAIPTYLEGADAPALTIFYEDGRKEDVEGIDRVEQVRMHLLGLVTEAANPRNRKGLARVSVQIASPFLRGGVVLIDTPGVGSTLQHNTSTAESTLASCDAALFVVSPDPPITEVEVNYLARIRPMVGRIVVILNKVDLLGSEETDAVQAFLRRTLADQAGMPDVQIFSVSARSALQGKVSGDATLIDGSGLPALETYLAEFLAREKGLVLGSAIAQKARAQVVELRFASDLRLQALRLPLADLEQRRRIFEEAVVGFETQRQVVRDLLTADLKRTLVALDEEAARLRSALAATLEAQTDQRIANNNQTANEAWAAVRAGAPALFDSELKGVISDLRTRLGSLFAAHQERGDELVDTVKRTAAEILDVPFQASPRHDSFEARFLPYWTVTRPETLNPIPPGMLDPILPRKLRARHARRRTSEAIADITMRNVENLRWAMRRNLDDAFRRFASEVDRRFAASLAVTREILSAAAERRTHYASESTAPIDRSQAASAELEEVERALAALVDNPVTRVCLGKEATLGRAGSRSPTHKPHPDT